MKKLIALVLVLAYVLVFTGCEYTKSSSDISEGAETDIQQPADTQVQEDPNAEATESQQTSVSEDNEPAIISPLPVTVDIAKLEDCMVAISLEKGDFYTDENGAIMMDVTVFVHDLYDMADIAMIKEGDTILRGQEEVLISSVERNENGVVLINGGLEYGGFELYTEENTVYYVRGYSHTKYYYELGKVSLPVSPDFIYNDASHLDKEAVIFSADDFLNDAMGIDYNFNAGNTTIQIEDGYVIAMTRVYRP